MDRNRAWEKDILFDSTIWHIEAALKGSESLLNLKAVMDLLDKFDPSGNFTIPLTDTQF